MSVLVLIPCIRWLSLSASQQGQQPGLQSAWRQSHQHAVAGRHEHGQEPGGKGELQPFPAGVAGQLWRGHRGHGKCSLWGGRAGLEGSGGRVFVRSPLSLFTTKKTAWNHLKSAKWLNTETLLSITVTSVLVLIPPRWKDLCLIPNVFFTYSLREKKTFKSLQVC